MLLGHFAEDFEFLSFEVRIEGDVWMLEIADNAHADEVFLLDSDPFLSVFQALSAQFERGHVGAVFTGVLEDCVFDRKAVSIPARDVVGIVASHVFVTDDDVHLHREVRRAGRKSERRHAVSSPLSFHTNHFSARNPRIPVPSSEGCRASGILSEADAGFCCNPFSNSS